MITVRNSLLFFVTSMAVSQAFAPLPLTRPGIRPTGGSLRQVAGPFGEPSLPLFKTDMSPSMDNHHHNSLVAVGAFLLALWAALAMPLPLEDASLVHHIPPMESSSHLLSKLEVQPLPGVGFGGIGMGPGFMPLPFGGFGAGFTIRNRPDPTPPDSADALEAQKQKLQSVKEYEKVLEAQVKNMEQQQQQQSRPNK